MRYSPRTRKIIITAYTIWGAVVLGVALPFWIISRIPNSSPWPAIPIFIVTLGGASLMDVITHYALKEQAGEDKEWWAFFNAPMKNSLKGRRLVVFVAAMFLLAIANIALECTMDNHLGIIEKYQIFFMAAGSLLGVIVGGGGFYWITARRMNMNNEQLDEPRQ